MTDAPVAPKSFLLTSELAAYLVGHGSPPDDVQRRAHRGDPRARRGVGDADRARAGRVPHHCSRGSSARARRSRSARSPATRRCASPAASPTDGRLLCCDVSEEWTAIARRAWERAGVADRIDLRIAPGADTLRALPKAETIDLAFIDADKPSYAVYYEEILARLRPNGVLLVDNVLWDGRVVQPDADDENTLAIRAFNDMVAADDRVEAVMLPIADGLTLCRKK